MNGNPYARHSPEWLAFEAGRSDVVRELLADLGFYPTDTGGGVLQYVRGGNLCYYILTTLEGEMPANLAQPVICGMHDESGMESPHESPSLGQFICNHARTYTASEGPGACPSNCEYCGKPASQERPITTRGNGDGFLHDDCRREASH